MTDRLAEIRAELRKADEGKGSEPWAVRDLLGELDAAQERIRDLRYSLAACEQEREKCRQSNAELTALGIDREIVIEDARARLAAAEEALRRSAETLHDLSEDPDHLRHIFAECPNYHCERARAALAAIAETENAR